MGIAVVLTILVVAAVAFLVYARYPARPTGLGVRDGRLSRCPSSPNCVSSFEDGEQRVEPLGIRGAPAEAMARLVETLGSFRGASIITQRDDYLHAEFRTPLVGFVDDVEFLLDAEAQQIDVRSASRRGYSDLGTNRKRVEAIRRAFEAATR